MISVARSILKSFFIPGAKPTSAQFNTLIDSMLNYSEDRSLLGLKNYDPTQIYVQGDTVTHSQIIYQAKQTTTPGAFNINSWDKIAGGVPGSINYKGTWDADSDVPELVGTVAPAGSYYVVSVAGDQHPGGLTDWHVGDWVISNGSDWEKIVNTDTVSNAENIEGDGAGIFKERTDTVLEFKRLTGTNGSLEIADNPDTVDIGIRFDDEGTSPNRAWSANKINAALDERQPLLGYTAENTANKVTAFSSSPSNVHYPSEKLLADSLAAKQNALGFIPENKANRVTAFTPFPSDKFYPTEKLLYDQVQLIRSDYSNVQNTQVKLNANVNPSRNDDTNKGFSAGSIWVNVIEGRAFTCVNATAGSAQWLETTSVVDYFSKEALSESGSDTYVSPYPFFDKLPITATQKYGMYRIQWSCVVHHQAPAGQGCFRLYDATNDKVISGPLVFEQKAAVERTPMGGIAIVKLTGVETKYILQYQTLRNGKFQYIEQARIEMVRIGNIS